LNGWVKEIRKYAETNTAIMVVGNKIDLPEDRKQVTAAVSDTFD
jgi:GTPase SAR1 family protein